MRKVVERDDIADVKVLKFSTKNNPIIVETLLISPHSTYTLLNHDYWTIIEAIYNNSYVESNAIYQTFIIL